MGGPDRDDAAELVALRRRLAGPNSVPFPDGVAALSDTDAWWPSANGNHADFPARMDPGLLEELGRLYADKPRWFLLIDGEPSPDLHARLDAFGLRRCNVYRAVTRNAADVPLPPFDGTLEDDGETFVARIDGVEVSKGELTIVGRTGYLGGMSTEEAYRRRGAQTALIAARIASAYRQGAARILSETYDFLPSSLNNLYRAGFSPAWNRPIYRFEQDEELRGRLEHTEYGHPSPRTT